jgi:uncharacterized membrane protein YsdA (DUF1294 family)
MIGYLIFINCLGLVLVYIDKRRAKKNKWRIREFYLFFIAALGGCYGVILSMYLFHHKTKKLKFKILMPIICSIWLIFMLKVM